MKKIILTITLLVMAIIIVGCGTKNIEGEVDMEIVGKISTTDLHFSDSYSFNDQKEKDEYFERKEFIIKSVKELESYVGYPENSTPFAGGGWASKPYDSNIYLTKNIGFNLYKTDYDDYVKQLTYEYKKSFFKNNNLLIIQGGYEFYYIDYGSAFIEGKTIYLQIISKKDYEDDGDIYLRRYILVIPKNSKINNVVFLSMSEYSQKILPKN